MIDPKRILDRAELYVDAPYRFGAEVKPTDKPGTKPLDCSELVEAVYRYFGIPMPDGSYNQVKALIVRPCLVPVALLTPAALLFHINSKGHVNHVGISDGKGGVIEATPTRVRHIKKTDPKRWRYGRLVKGVHYK